MQASSERGRLWGLMAALISALAILLMLGGCCLTAISGSTESHESGTAGTGMITSGGTSGGATTLGGGTTTGIGAATSSGRAPTGGASSSGGSTTSGNGSTTGADAGACVPSPASPLQAAHPPAPFLLSPGYARGSSSGHSGTGRPRQLEHHAALHAPHAGREGQSYRVAQQPAGRGEGVFGRGNQRATTKKVKLTT